MGQLRVNLWWWTCMLLPMEEGEVRLHALLTWAKLELVRLRDGILHTILVCLLHPRAPQRRSVWQGCGKQGKTICLGQPSSGWVTAPFLLQEPLVGVGECWRLVGGQTVNGELGTSHDSGKTCCWGWLWPSSPLPSAGVRIWWTSQQ